jgi:hypothetical protein
MVDKDLIKFLRKNLSPDNPNNIPLKAVMKKRGTNFAFLMFSDRDQLKSFQDLYALEMLPKFPKMKLKDVNSSKRMNSREF